MKNLSKVEAHHEFYKITLPGLGILTIPDYYDAQTHTALLNCEDTNRLGLKLVADVVSLVMLTKDHICEVTTDFNEREFTKNHFIIRSALGKTITHETMFTNGIQVVSENDLGGIVFVNGDAISHDFHFANKTSYALRRDYSPHVSWKYVSKNHGELTYVSISQAGVIEYATKTSFVRAMPIQGRFEDETTFSEQVPILVYQLDNDKFQLHYPDGLPVTQENKDEICDAAKINIKLAHERSLLDAAALLSEGCQLNNVITHMSHQRKNDIKIDKGPKP